MLPHLLIHLLILSQLVYEKTTLPWVIRLVREPPPSPELVFELPEIGPGIVRVQPRMEQGLVHRETLASLDLK
jgi:hypothetical protein